uniref:Uncharacterized protein n=1 Tax=Panagrolaimus sp. JU765 TaxID=591449 RepID=A0AC34QY74_9BILA
MPVGFIGIYLLLAIFGGTFFVLGPFFIQRWTIGAETTESEIDSLTDDQNDNDDTEIDDFETLEYDSDSSDDGNVIGHVCHACHHRLHAST